MTTHSEYGEGFVAGLQYMWGQGFLSPGGREEVATILEGVSINGCRVLDIGCGLGAIDVLLVEEHHAQSVVCIDVEPELIEQARRMHVDTDAAKRLDFRLVEPGPLPFADSEFDVVFSKDSIIHIPNKTACYQEIARVLKPDGLFAFSDWYGSEQPLTQQMQQWLEVVNLSFSLGTLQEAADTLRRVGLEPIRVIDRNEWYRQYMAQELGSISGDNYHRLVELVGKQTADHRVASSTLKREVVEQGQLRPGLVQAINRTQDLT